MTESILQKIDSELDERLRCQCGAVLTPIDKSYNAFCDPCNSKLRVMTKKELSELWKYHSERKIAEKLQDLPTVHKDSSGIYVDKTGVRYEKVESFTPKQAAALKDKSWLFACLNEKKWCVRLKKK